MKELLPNKLDEGKKILKEALAIDKTKGSIYIGLVNIYEEETNYTDFIITLGQGIDNSKDKGELEERLSEISSEIDIAEIKAKADKGEKFELPENV